jgi:hypothetical protein
MSDLVFLLHCDTHDNMVVCYASKHTHADDELLHAEKSPNLQQLSEVPEAPSVAVKNGMGVQKGLEKT